MVEEWFLVHRLLLGLLVPVMQGNPSSALPHDGSRVAVAAKQGESWLPKQAREAVKNQGSD